MSVLRVLDCDKCYKWESTTRIKSSRELGKEFRNTYFIPWLKKKVNAKKLTIDFSGTEAFTSCFLEEVFAGSIRQGYHQVKDIRIVGVPNTVRDSIEEYIEGV